ncbi:MAG: hypothetical protein JO097_03670 [Acidobacteriaceae bacterium]|nr:hypothetical protein [Acidobacteriaceae bacterium]
MPTLTPEKHEGDPQHHVNRLQKMLSDTAQHAREDVTKVEDPKARALFETTAEVLDGLNKAFTHYVEKSEPAWQDRSSAT